MPDHKSRLVRSLAPSPLSRPFPYDPSPPPLPSPLPPFFSGLTGVSVYIGTVSVPDTRPPSSGVGKRGGEPLW